MKDVARRKPTRNGHRNVLVLATSAYPGYSSCRQYREDYGVALEQLGLEGRVRVGKIRQFFRRARLRPAPSLTGLKNGLKQVATRWREQHCRTRYGGSLGTRACALCSAPTRCRPLRRMRRARAASNYEGGSAYVEKHLQVARAVLSHRARGGSAASAER